MQFSDVLHTLVDYAETAFGAAKSEAHDAIDEMYPKAVTVLGERATQIIDGVERYVDDGTVVSPAPEASQPPEAPQGAPSGETASSDAAAGDAAAGAEAGTTSPTIEAPAADPINPTVSSVFDSSGAVVGTLDSTTGEFTPVAAPTS